MLNFYRDRYGFIYSVVFFHKNDPPTKIHFFINQKSLLKTKPNQNGQIAKNMLLIKKS